MTEKYNYCDFEMMAACRAVEALAQPEQEPVAWQHRKPIMDSQGNTRGYYDWLPGKGLERWPHRRLYTSPPEQHKPMTDEQIEQAYRHIYRNLPDDFDHTSMGWIEQGIKYAEQAHGIKGKNT